LGLIRLKRLDEALVELHLAADLAMTLPLTLPATARNLPMHMVWRCIRPGVRKTLVHT
jgi:hypothetical protein